MAPANAAATRVLGIRKLEIAAPFEGRPFVYRTGDHAYQRDPYAAFLDTPAESLVVTIREWLRGAVSRLNPRIAEMFSLRFFEGKDNPEIARLLNTTPGTVAVTLSRTRNRLEKEYRAYVGGVA